MILRPYFDKLSKPYSIQLFNMRRQTRPDYFCDRAMDVAMKSTMQHRHGCVIVYNDKEIVAEGYNHMRFSPMENIFSIHAEMDAINKLRQIARTKSKDFIDKCKLYVVRIGTERMDFPMKLSVPCMHCSRLINTIGIPRVCYSINDQEVEEEYIPREIRRRLLRNMQQLTDRFDEVMEIK